MSNNAESKGRRGSRAVRAFDFRGVGTNPRPYLRTLGRMHDVLAERVAAALGKTLRADVAVEPMALELVGFDDYVRSMPQITVLSSVALNPLPGHAVIEVNAQLALVMIERILGGEGTAPSLRRLTDIEMTVIDDVLVHVRDGMRATFDPLVEVTPEHAGTVFDPSFLATADPTESVVLLAYQITISSPSATSEGILTVCYPQTTIGSVLRQLAAHDDEPAAAVTNGPLSLALPDVEVQVSLRLHESPLPASDLAELQPGDVLRLDHRVVQPVTGYVGGAPVFEGHLGQRGLRRAVQITGIRSNSGPNAELAPPADGEADQETPS